MQKEFPNKILISLIAPKKYENQVIGFPAIELQFKGVFSGSSEFAQILLEDSKGFNCSYITKHIDKYNNVTYDAVLLELPKNLFLKDEISDDEKVKNVYVYTNGNYEKIGKVVEVL